MKRLFTVALTLVLANAAPALGQADVEQALETLRRTLEQDDSLSPQTRKALQDFAEAMQAQLRSAPKTPTPDSTGTALAEAAMEQARADEEDLWDRLEVYGDLRFRYEGTLSPDAEDRHRTRLRFRLRATYQVDDELLIGGGVRTGTRSDPNSPYVTLGDGFEDFQISIDLLYLTYRPQWAEGSWLTAGKFVHPFYRNPVYGELVWDADVNPEGIVGGYRINNGSRHELDLILGGYTVLENATVDDVYMLAAQAVYRGDVAEEFAVNAALGYYLYSRPIAVAGVGGAAGNAVVGIPPQFVSDFGILNPIVAATYTGWGVPVTVSGEYIWNSEANISQDRGWAVGVSVGSSKKKGDWRGYYQWQVIEQDAVLATFAQDDFVRATNFRGSVVGVNYQFTDDIGLHLWTLVSRPEVAAVGESGDDTWRLRADLTIKF